MIKETITAMMLWLSRALQKKDIVYPVEILVTEGFSKPTKFQADSIFTIGKEELGEKITELSPDIMADVNTALQIELNLE